MRSVKMELKEKDLMQWKSQDWVKLVNLMNTLEYEAGPSLKKEIFIIECQLALGNSLFDILKNLKSLDKNYNQRNLTDRHNLLQIRMKVHDSWAEKEYESSFTNPLIIIQIDALNIRFYAEAKKQMKRISQFWKHIHVHSLE